MKVDIALVTYNQADYIKQALEGIIMQEVKEDVEINLIISDDFSTDNTLEIIKSYSNRFHFTYTILESQCNLGVSKNYRRILEFCQGDYVAILEGDDYWTDKFRLQKHIDYLSTHINCVFTKNDYLIYEQNHNRFIHEELPGQVVILKDMINNHKLVNLSCYVFRNKFLKLIKDEVYLYGDNQRREAFDWYLNVFLLQFGYGYVINDIMSVYRVDTGANISRRKISDKEYISLSEMCSRQTLDLIGNSYINECRKIHANIRNDVKNEKIKSMIQKYSDYFPPILVVFVFEYIPKIIYSMKFSFRKCIPNKLYRFISKIMKSDVK